MSLNSESTVLYDESAYIEGGESSLSPQQRRMQALLADARVQDAALLYKVGTGQVTEAEVLAATAQADPDLDNMQANPGIQPQSQETSLVGEGLLAASNLVGAMGGMVEGGERTSEIDTELTNAFDADKQVLSEEQIHAYEEGRAPTEEERLAAVAGEMSEEELAAGEEMVTEEEREQAAARERGEGVNVRDEVRAAYAQKGIITAGMAKGDTKETVSQADVEQETRAVQEHLAATEHPRDIAAATPDAEAMARQLNDQTIPSEAPTLDTSRPGLLAGFSSAKLPGLVDVSPSYLGTGLAPAEVSRGSARTVSPSVPTR